ncbi:hypothetical protein CF392_11360 [Tamilnaduibacter salinus]|uniref:MFS transporter n=1 Tax=Tamilnaduibacter salinus TaxID=1484056 RepID=A0A2A2I239_9GAMM|nr:MFS transporter [Tamilnaduibacter salinus]PAV25354.1 hypothetical protein CF392_11360 [Tamilnaduibacter salinus]
MRWVLALGTVGLMGLYQSSLMVSLPWMIEHSGLSAGLWSVLMAVGMILVVVGGPLWGRQADQRGAGPIMRLTLGLVVVGYMVLVLALIGGGAGWWLIGAVAMARLLHGLGAGGVFPSTQRFLLSSRPPSRWSVELAQLQAANQIGRLAGPGLMAVASLLSVPLGLSAIAVAGLALWVLQWRQVGGVTGGAVPSTEPVTPPGWRPDWPLYLLALLITTWVGLLQFVLGPYIQQLLAVDAVSATRMTGYYLMLSSVVALVVGPLGHRWLAGRHGLLSGIWLSALVAGGLVLAVAVTPLGLAVGIALVVSGLALATPWYGSLLRGRWPAAQGQVSGRLTSVHTTGYGIGTLAGGVALEWAPEQALLPFLVLGPLALVCYLAHRRQEVRRVRPHRTGG